MSPFDIIKDRDRVRKTVFYGRVSTEHEAQLSALENQIPRVPGHSQRMSLSDAQQKKINSLRGRIQASENIENGKFPEIKRLTNMIGQV